MVGGGAELMTRGVATLLRSEGRIQGSNRCPSSLFFPLQGGTEISGIVQIRNLARATPLRLETTALLRIDRTEHAVLLHVQARGEVKCLRRRVERTAEAQRPKRLIDYSLVFAIPEFALELALRIVGVDLSVAEVADQEVIGELAECRRRDRDAPW